MDRNSKARSTRLSGIFDLFSEDKTGRDNDNISQERSQEKSPKETKEKKVNLFSFRKKCESESKVHEKRKSKPIIRYFSSDHSSKEMKSVKGRDESIDYECTKVILRKPRLARDLMQNQNSLLDQGERLGQGHLDLSFPTEEVERPQSSPCEISPTACKGLVTSSRPKLFRFSSRQKEKLTEPSGTGMSHSSSSFHHQITSEKEMKAKVMGEEILQPPSNSEDVLIISHGKSVKRFRSEGRCEELYPVDKPVIVSSEISSDFVIAKEENRAEAVSRNKMIPLCSETMQDAENDWSKNTTDVSENHLKKYFGFLAILVRNLFIFLKSSVIFFINFVLFLPRNLLLAIKSLFIFVISSCNGLSLGIKTRLSRTDQRELNEDSELQKRIDKDYASDINQDGNHETVATVSRYEQWQWNHVDTHGNESHVASKSCKSKWQRLLRQLSKDGRQKLNRANSASDFDEPEESKTCITETEISRNQGNHLLPESYGKQEDSVDLATVEVKQERSLIRSFFLFTQKAFELLLSIVLFIPLNAIYALKYFFSNIYYLVFRNPVKLSRNSKSVIHPDLYVHHDSKLREMKREHDEKTKHERSLSVFGLIKKRREGSRKENIKDDVNPSNTTAGFSHDSNSGGTSVFGSPFFDPKVPMKKVVSFFSALFYFIGLCLVTLINCLVKVISNIFVFMKLVLSISIRLICLPFVLLGKAIIFLVRCVQYLIWLLGMVIFCAIKVFCIVILLIMSLPIGVIVLLKISVCFLVDVLWNWCLMVVRRGSMKQLQRDDEENNTTALEPEAEIRGKVRVKQGGKIEKILKRLHVNALFKKRKKSPERGAFSAEHSSLRCSVRKHASSESESITPVMQEKPQTHRYHSDLKQGTVVRKLFAFAVKPLLNILSIILAFPLRILAVFRMTLYSLLSCMKISSWSHNNSDPVLISDLETSAETALPSTGDTSGESNDGNHFLNLEITNAKLRRSDSSGEHVSDSWEDESNLDSGQSFMNLTANVKSVSEDTNEETERKKCPFDPRPYLMRTTPFFRIFFHLQSIFVAALWHRIDVVMSSIVKMLLLGILRLTPSVVIKWMTTAAVRFTPGIKNRKILLSFLEDTPATITKRALEAYVKRVPISVMMVHAQITLKDSTSKTVVRCMSEILKSVKKAAESFFMNVSSIFKQLSKKMRIRKSKERSSLKERVLHRLKSEDGCHKKRHVEQ